MQINDASKIEQNKNSASKRIHRKYKGLIIHVRYYRQA